MRNVLNEIIEKKREDLKGQKKDLSFEEIKKKAVKNAQGLFKKALSKKNKMGIIAEVKLASPTVSHLGDEKDILNRVATYEEAGADAVSLITEKHYFKGSVDFVSEVKNRVDLPILQKDFIIDPYQIYEASFAGSDALLLIVRLVDKATLKEFVSISQSLGIEPVVEINNEEDLQKAVATKCTFIAVNARNLENFAIDVKQACQLMKKIPASFLKLGFSGVTSSDEVRQYKKAGARAVLVGTALMRRNDITKFIASLNIV